MTVNLLLTSLPAPDVHITDAGVETVLAGVVRIINPLLDALWESDPFELKRRDDPTAKRVERWDKPYYENKLKEERFQVDLQEASSYFQTDNVVKNTMALYSDLLGIAFEETPAEGAWHPEVRAFAISDAKSGRRLGWLYLDLYPRDGKYNHAAEFSIVSARRREHEGYREPVAAIVTNFPRATPGSPSLLDFENVRYLVPVLEDLAARLSNARP